jgi:hypothetical protein
MPLPVILAHGALGPYDELIMLSAAAIFLIIMGISWVRSRNTRPSFEEENQREQPQPTDAQPADEPQGRAPDRFRLD